MNNNKEDLFDNGIDGEPFDHPDEYIDEEYCREDIPIWNSNGVEVTAWPTYMNYTIITDRFHIYLYFGSGTIKVFDLNKPSKDNPNFHECVLSMKPFKLSFFGEMVNGDYVYSAEKINHKIERYINMRAFL